MRPPGLVIFDCDGVLVDSEPLSMRVLLETLKGKGLSLETEVAYELFLGRSLASAQKTLAEDFGLELDDAALAEMRERLFAAFRAELKPIQGVAEVIDGLHQPFCVASSSQPERIEVSLRATGLWSRFEGRVFSATMVRNGKPAPDLFLFAADVMGVSPSDCLVVEDSPAGLSAARAAGMRVVGFTGGGHARSAAHRSRLERLSPDQIIDQMRALPGLLA